MTELPILRLSRDQLFEITGRVRAKNQVAWFREHLSVTVPCDSVGPVLTQASYEAILAKKLGVLDKTTTPATGGKVHTPTPRSVKARPTPALHSVVRVKP